jgi:hypothetical protein
VLGFNMTEHPNAEWTAMQVAQAFPRNTAPRCLIPGPGSDFRKGQQVDLL